MILRIALAAGLLLSACGDAPDDRRPNFLIVVGDDIGVEQLASFGIGAAPARTPHLDALARRGIQFSRTWAQPMCSPTRATLLTGRFGFRTGVGSAVGPQARGPYPGPDDPEIGPLAPRPGARPEALENLAEVFQTLGQYRRGSGIPPVTYGITRDELTLPALLAAGPDGYDTAAFGKWHLGDQTNGWLDHPAVTGFDHFSVTMLNQPESYYAWYENVNGRLEARSGYAPARKVDDAIEWIGARDENPWFLWLAFSLPHFPHHVPEVQGLDTSGVGRDDARAAVDSMTARMDEELGRLLAAIAPDDLENTVVVFVGDNGTTGEAIDPPFRSDRAKFTLYEGGLRVPLVIAGPGIPEGATSTALVNTTDLFTTVLDLAGVAPPTARPTDSNSLTHYFRNPQAPTARGFAYADAFFGASGVEEGAFAARDDRYKLIRWHDRQELYDLASDPYESRDLLADGVSGDEQAAIVRLEQIVEELRR